MTALVKTKVHRTGAGLTSLVIKDEHRARMFRYHIRKAAGALIPGLQIPHEVGHLMSTRTELTKWESRIFDRVRENMKCGDSEFESVMRDERAKGIEEFIDFTSKVGGAPYEIHIVHGNLFLYTGINNIWNLVCGAGGTTAYNNANARIGVAESATAANATQSDLQGATKTYKAMDATFPTSGSSQQATFKSTFASGDANNVWQEWIVDNGATALIKLNRKVENLGTKVSGATWALTVNLSLA